MLIGKMSNIEMRVSFSDEKTILRNLRLSTSPEDKNMVKIDMEEDLLIYSFKSIKVTSVYSLADELLKSYDVIKKMEKLGD